MTRFQALTWNLLQDHMGLDMATAILAIYLTSMIFTWCILIPIAHLGARTAE